MRLRDVMTTRVEWVSPDMTVEEAAQRMRRLDVGALPVCEGGRLVGMLTDRDIVVRGVSAGYDLARALVGELASRDLIVGHEDQHVDEIARLMQARCVRRIPVVDEDRRLLGMVTVEDLAARAGEAEQAARVIATTAHAAETGGETKLPGDDGPAQRRGRDADRDQREGDIMAERYGMGNDHERRMGRDEGRGREDERRGMGGRDFEMSQQRGYGDMDRGMGRDYERGGTGRDYDMMQRSAWDRDYDRGMRGESERGSFGQRGYGEQGGMGRGYGEQGGWGQQGHGRRSMYEGGGMMGRGYEGQESRMYGQDRGYGQEGRMYEQGGMGYQGGGMGGQQGGMGYQGGGMGGFQGGMGRQGGWEQQGRVQSGMGEGGMSQRFGARRGPKGYKRSDERIREDVCDRLSEHPIIDSSDVEIKVQNGEVTLTGTVTERRHKHLIEQVAEAISGVQDVTNQIRVKREETEMRGEQQRTGTESTATGTTGRTQTTSQGRTAS